MSKGLSYNPSDTKITNLAKQGRTTIKFEISTEELSYYNSVLAILYNLRVNGKPVLRSGEIGLPALSKMSLEIMMNNYKNHVLSNDAVIDSIPIEDEKTLENLLAFRAKYLNYPIDKQIANLKAKGVLA